jgi:hypothetical protein
MEIRGGPGGSWTCDWRIIVSPMIPQGSPSCYDSAMRNLVVLFIHLIATLARLLGPGGVRSKVAESLLLRHQLLIVNRSRQRSPNLSAWDRILAGWMGLLVRPTRLLRSVSRPVANLRSFSDTRGCLTFQRLALAAVSGQPSTQNLKEIIRCLSS